MKEEQPLNLSPILKRSNFLFNLTHEGLVKPVSYVDKTAYIAQVINSKAFYSLCRPRRFGKSSTLWVIEDLFLNGLKNWQNCQIAKEQLFDESQTFPVFLFDFSTLTLSSLEEFSISLKEQIAYNASKYNIKLDVNSGSLSKLLKESFSQLAPQQVVVLIDEYDNALIETMHNPELYKKILTNMSEFYKTLKSLERQIRFLLVTGVNRVSNLSIFSGFNNIVDISFDTEYSSIVGYTEQELLDNFSEQLLKIATFYKMDFKEFMEQLKARYNGYCFDKNLKITVFNTWDINSLLTSPISNTHPSDFLPAYWAVIGSLSSFIIQYFAYDQNKFIDFIGKTSTEGNEVDQEELTKPQNFLETPIHVFMFNAGYLTLSKPESICSKKFQLDFPNETIKNFVLKDLINSLSSFASSWTNILTSSRKSILQLFDLNTSDQKRKEILSQVFISSCDVLGSCFASEIQLRTFLIIIFRFVGLDVRFEVAKLRGRIDLLIIYNHQNFIIELKAFKSILLEQPTAEAIAKQSKKLMFQAFNQIEKREYAYALPCEASKYFGAIIGDCSTGKITDFSLKSPSELQSYLESTKSS